MEVKPVGEVRQYLFNDTATAFAGRPNGAAALAQLSHHPVLHKLP